MSDSDDERLASASAVLPSPGSGVLACVDKKYTVRNPLRVCDDVTGDIPEVLAAGTLTMFCFMDGQHYALTSHSVGCGDRYNLQTTTSLNDSFSPLSYMTRTYFFKQNNCNVENEDISLGYNAECWVPLGKCHKYYSDNECKILLLKIFDQTNVNCAVLGLESPNWDNIWNELYMNMYASSPVRVEKVGFGSGLTHGYIVSLNASYENLFHNAIVVKGCGGPFLQEGDSGALVYFFDKTGRKQVFAYAVGEVDERCIPELHKPRSSDDNYNSDSDTGSICSAEDSSCDSTNDTLECEGQNKSEDGNECGDKNKYKKDDVDSESDVEIVFEEENRGTGPYYICLRLDIALKKLGINEAGCLRDCGKISNRLLKFGIFILSY